MFLLNLALLNLQRNPTRSIITIAAIGLCTAGLVFLFGFRDSIILQMESNPIHEWIGHIQIHGKGFLDGFNVGTAIPDLDKVEATLNNTHEIQVYTKRLRTQSLISTHDTSLGVHLVGIDPSSEPKVTTLPEDIKQGRFFSQQSTHELLIGDGLASKLNLKLGDRPAIVTRSLYGTSSGLIGRIVGIYHCGSSRLDDHVVFIPLSDMTQLLDLEGQYHEISIMLRDGSGLPKVTSSLRNTIHNDDCEIQPWYELQPEIQMWERFYAFMINVMFLGAVLVIAVMIMNVVLMSVLERTRELGIMLAIGTSPIQLGGLVLIETILLELFGLALGASVGILITIYFGHTGICFKGMEKTWAQFSIGTTVHPAITFESLLSAILTIIGVSTVVSIYPIIKTMKLQPVKAIYHSRT